MEVRPLTDIWRRWKRGLCRAATDSLGENRRAIENAVPGG